MEIITRKEAIEQGLSKFFTGKPCKHGHIALRKVSDSHCIDCAKNKNKIYMQNNKEKRRKYEKEYYSRPDVKKRQSENGAKRYKEKRTEILKQRAEFAANNPDLKKRNEDYRKRNKDKILASMAVYYRANKSRCIENASKRKVSLLNATPKWQTALSCSTKYKESVTMGRLTGIKHHVDHIIPLQGKNVCGLHVPENLRVIPARDNLRKSNLLA